jgi:PAS domain S-box-containing protein
MKINLRLVLVITSIALIPLIVLVFVAYSSAKSQIDSETISKLTAEADIQKSRIENRNKENQQYLTLLVKDPDIVERMAAYDQTPDSQNIGDIQNSLTGDGITDIIPSFKEVQVVNLSGIIIASTNPKSAGADISNQMYFQKGKITDVTTDFSKDQNGVVTLNLSSPITLNGKTLGVLVIKSDGSNITSVVTDYTGLGNTGETLLVVKNPNGDALFLTPTRFDPNAALTRIVPKGKTNIPSTHAINGEEIEMLNAVDYNNTPVIAVTRYVPETGWGIVAKINQAEAYAPIINLRNLFIFMTVVSAIIVVAVAYATGKTFTDPIKMISTVAEKIGSGDLSKRVTVNSADEIGTLGRVFNETVSKLQASYQNLEKNVADRTSELSSTVKDLEDSRRASLNVLEDINTEKTKYESLLSGIGDAVIATDSQTKIIVINPAAEEILGLTREEVLGKKLLDILPVVNSKGELLEFNNRPINKAISTMKPFSTSVDDDYYYLRKDGTKIPVALTASPVIANGQLIGVIDVFRDISHEKDVDRMKTEFVSLSSHQLRTPLTAIKWGLEVLLGSDIQNLTAKQKDELDDINSSTLRMIDLVNSLLNVSRIESGRIIVNPIPTNIVKLANDVVSKLKLELTRKNISLVMNVADNLPEINLDQSLIFNVYQNLISNAISYSPGGSKITVSISVKDGAVISSVKDEGIGIPENEKAKLFQKFFRASNAIKIRPDGSGLGLYVNKSIVESSGGKLWFESEAGKGTTFYFSLPLTGMKPKEGEVSISNEI